MPRLDADTWTLVRAEYEGGASFRDLGQKYGVTKSVIHKRKEKERWERDLGPAIDRETRRKVATIEAANAGRTDGGEANAAGGSAETALLRQVDPAKNVKIETAADQPKLQQGRNEIIDAEAQRRAEVITRHRAEWGQFYVMSNPAIREYKEGIVDKDRFLCLQRFTQALTQKQEGERKAWGITGDPQPNGGNGIQIVISPTDAEL